MTIRPRPISNGMDIQSFLVANLPLLIKLVVAIFLGGLLGIERSVARKTAGLRTYAIVSLGSCLFILTSTMAMAQFPGTTINPLYVIAAIATGIGFLCGGVIIYHENKLEGLTTAAGMWVAAGIGIASAFGLFALATLATVLTILIFSEVLWDVEEKIRQG